MYLDVRGSGWISEDPVLELLGGQAKIDGGKLIPGVDYGIKAIAQQEAMDMRIGARADQTASTSSPSATLTCRSASIRRRVNENVPGEDLRLIRADRCGGDRRLLPALPVAQEGRLRVAPGARIYAAYGGVYIGVAIFWLWIVDAVRPATTDLVGVAISLAGMAVIIMGAEPR